MTDICEVCGDPAETILCNRCYQEGVENESSLDEWGKAWNILFPDETDDWEYPGQLYRCVLTEIMARTEALKRVLETLGRLDELLFFDDPKPAHMVITALRDFVDARLSAEAGQAQTDYLDIVYYTGNKKNE